MTRIDLVAEGADVRGLERQSRDDGDAVIALLPVQRDVLIAKPLETLQREGVVDAFGFLQAQYVRPHRLDEFGDEIDAQAHRVDIPRCQGETHGWDLSVHRQKGTPHPQGSATGRVSK